MVTWPDTATASLLAMLTEQLDLVVPHALALRRELHRHPDLSGAERPTADRLRHALPTFKATRVADTGFLVRVGPPGPAVLIRAELDALPLVEATGVDWAATGGAMHACGHDVHLAALWALLQAARKVELPVGLIGLFQPREEVQPSGAQSVVASGVLKDDEVAAVVGAHVQPRVVSGVVSTGMGAVNAAADEFEITIHGQPGHGAYPHITIDPVPILAAIINGMQELVSRTIDPVHPSVITIGRIEAGTAANIIPASGQLSGVIRTMYEQDRLQLHTAIRSLVNHTAAARGATADIEITTGHPLLVNDRRLVQFTDPLLDHLGIPVAHEPFRSCGADDFSHYSQIAPTLMMFVGVHQDPAAPISQDAANARSQVGLHHPTFLPSSESVGLVARSLMAGFLASAQLARH
ncbi:MAG TPA: M20 family metallopeptidase [Propionicimonas sp.]|jgi:amidohydrolase|nr:M20 family metallopeptidase [Propionicimonas sp.]